MWQTQKSSDTALDPRLIHDICVAEESTQRVLEEKGLCFGCTDGCLPPFSIVLYARLQVDNGMAMDCEELSQAWAPFQASTEEQWKTCVEELKGTYTSNGESCPIAFSTSMVDESFDGTVR